MMDLKVIASSCGMPMNDIPIYSSLVLHSSRHADILKIRATITGLLDKLVYQGC